MVLVNLFIVKCKDILFIYFDMFTPWKLSRKVNCVDAAKQLSHESLGLLVTDFWILKILASRVWAMTINID